MAGRIRQEDVEAVRERTDLVRLVQQYVGLKKAGGRYAGLCPFHTEKTASFSVDPAQQLYHCFGCGVGGNAYQFLMAIEHLSFPEAVERLAKQAGVPLRYEGLSSEDRRAMGRRQILYRANATAGELYNRMLLEGKEGEDARRFLSSRAISKEAVGEFGIGYAPRYPDFLLRRMSGDFSPEILVEAGLAVKGSDGVVRDAFRGRVTFPIHDLTGQAIGFGARLLEGDGPKYRNTAETALYRKGELLYNLHRAKAEITASGTAFVVEGYTDVIALHEAGLPTGVATCGTALSEGHLRLLARFAKVAVLAFDSDEAGARAAERAFGFFEEHGLEVRVLVLPEGLDPADFVRERERGAFEEAAAGAVPLVEYVLRRSLRDADGATPEGRSRAVRLALPILERLRDEVLRETYAGVLADLTGASPSSVLLELERSGRDGGREGPARAPARKTPRAENGEPPEVRAPVREVEREALKLLLQHSASTARRLGPLADDAFATERHRRVVAAIREHGGAASAIVERLEDDGLRRFVAELAVEPIRGDAGDEYEERVFSRLEEFSLTRRIDAMKRRLERMNPLTHSEYDSLFEELIALEGERRRVRSRVGEGVGGG